MARINLYSLFSFLLFPLAFLYAYIMKIRRKNYKKGKQYKANIPVISVGNISWGGTGKTPIVEYLINFANKEELKAVILSRGYGAKPPTTPLLVEPKNHKASECGDEPLMLALANANLSIQKPALVVVDPNRVQGAKFAQENLSPELFILDDGFSHLKIERDIDLVLLSKIDLSFGFNKVIPSGTWREPKTALKDASAFLIKANKEEWEDICNNFDKKFYKYNRALFGFHLNPIALVGEDEECAFSVDKDFAFITGIGKPEQAYKSVTNFINKKAQLTKYYKDHHKFTQEDANFLQSLNMQIVCTHKDFVKLKEFNIPNIYYLKVKAEFFASHKSAKNFDEWFSDTYKTIGDRNAK